ncbi:MAG TPA: hypothetical protein DGT21_14095, partial [Armatimonadetes bacterium]|nr:hypothetical protein [Armatimonadota bacterium]
MEGLPVETGVETAVPEAEQVQRGVTVSAFVISVILLVVSMIWLSAAELVGKGAQISESVPVIPAMGALLLLTPVAPLLRKLWRRISITQADVMLVYVFLCISVTCASVGVVRLLLPSLTVTRYFATPENNFTTLSSYLPKWLIPQDDQAVRDMYEGADGEVVPWGTWIEPLAWWSVFLIATYASMLGIMSLFRR